MRRVGLTREAGVMRKTRVATGSGLGKRHKGDTGPGLDKRGEDNKMGGAGVTRGASVMTEVGPDNRGEGEKSVQCNRLSTTGLIR